MSGLGCGEPGSSRGPGAIDARRIAIVETGVLPPPGIVDGAPLPPPPLPFDAGALAPDVAPKPASCPPSSNFGSAVGTTVANLSAVDCAGKTVSLHSYCNQGQGLLLMLNSAS